ncbi:aspartate dehydrogenase [Falsirhodobacter sp. alg1]|uniref:aspartate dehydrogenase n=1 Tax=Falsirhodobacter sp. alg1 TaxID=1472418 RepID=UPI0007896182|nr:aspartate dehydrogenase [Falsirhodobacter sp. alg1]
MTRPIALIGFGAIAQDLMKKADHDPQINVTQILVRPARKALIQSTFGGRIQAITDVSDLSDDTDFVLECAGHEALHSLGPQVLLRGVDLGILSVGALSDMALERGLKDAATKGGAQATLLPGAIGGIDALAAAGSVGLDHVIYTGTKAPRSWRGTPAEDRFDLDRLGCATEIFAGSAREAARLFPKNANVVATVALAGLGFDDTQVRLIADPAVTRNTHRIQATGPLLDLDLTTTAGTLPDNPKTSALTSASAYRALKSRNCAFVL